MATKEEVIGYVMTTPSNPNRAVLSGMLDSVADAGGGTLRVNITSFDPVNGAIYDKTWQEVYDALANGNDVTYVVPGTSNMRLRILEAVSAPNGSAYAIIAEAPSGAVTTTPTLVLDHTSFTQLTSPDDYLKVSLNTGGGSSGTNPPIEQG